MIYKQFPFLVHTHPELHWNTDKVGFVITFSVFYWFVRSFLFSVMFLYPSCSSQECGH